VHSGNAGILNPQDDSVIENLITVGSDGIRQTPLIATRVECVNVPTQQELQDYLDRIFGRQANIWFTITNYNEADAAYDVGSSDGFHANHPEIAVPNRHFDFFMDQESSPGTFALSREEEIVHTASKDIDATFNLYFLPTEIAMNVTLSGNFHVRRKDMSAYARANLRTPYVEANSSPFASTKKDLLKTAAHEIAHSTFFGPATDPGGLHHPWSESSVPPITILPYHPEDNFTNLDMDTDKSSLMWYARQDNESFDSPPGKLTYEEVWRLQTCFGPNEQQQ
jgi:hypothetical protein